MSSKRALLLIDHDISVTRVPNPALPGSGFYWATRVLGRTHDVLQLRARKVPAKDLAASEDGDVRSPAEITLDFRKKSSRRGGRHRRRLAASRRALQRRRPCVRKLPSSLDPGQIQKKKVAA